MDARNKKKTFWTPSKMGKIGGKTKGKTKSRGDSAYYSQLAKKRGKGAKSSRNKQSGGI